MALKSTEKRNSVVEVELISDLMRNTMLAINNLRKECSLESISYACDVLNVGTQLIDVLYNGENAEICSYEQECNPNSLSAHEIPDTQIFAEHEYEQSVAEQLSDAMSEYQFLELESEYVDATTEMERSATRALLVRTLEQKIANKAAMNC